MNKPRRKQLDKLCEMFVELKDMLEEIRDDEENYMDNIPENLQGSERYSIAEDAIDNMNLALDSLDEVISYIESAAER